MTDYRNLTVNVERNNSEQLFVFRIEGVLDAQTSPDLEKEISKVIDEDNNWLLINLEGLDYISSAGIRTLMATSKKIDAMKGKFALCSPSNNVFSTIKNSGFGNFFVWKDTEEEALGVFSTPRQR